MKLYSILLLLIITIFSCGSQNIDITDRTELRSAPNLKIIKGLVTFKPGNIKDKVGRLPSIEMDIIFENIDVRDIKSIQFEVISLCRMEGISDLVEVRSKSYTYPDIVYSGHKEHFIYEPASVDKLTLPVKQIIQISYIEYTDGTGIIWHR